MIYFNISGIGVLTLDKILFEFDNLPILVVCLDTSGNRYFCLCTDPIMEFTWLISRISLNSLIDVIQNKISVLDAFKNSNNKIYLYNDLKNTWNRFLSILMIFLKTNCQMIVKN